MNGSVALKQAKNYVDVTLKGAGALKGQKGDPGKDGISPTVTTTPITGGQKVIITDTNGEHNFDVRDGLTPLILNANFGDVPQIDFSYEILPAWLNRNPVSNEQISGIVTVENITYYVTGTVNMMKDDTISAIFDKVTKLTGEVGIGGFSPIITENLENTHNVYRLDITDNKGTFTTPNLMGSSIDSNLDYIEKEFERIEHITPVILMKDAWIGTEAPYTQTVNIIGAKEEWNPILVSMLDDGATLEIQKSYVKAYSIISSGSGIVNDGSATFTVYKKPEIDITVGLRGCN